MNYKKEDLPFNSFIGGWYMPTDVCDDLIALYERNPEHHHPGKLGDREPNPDIKDSIDLSFKWNESEGRPYASGFESNLSKHNKYHQNNKKVEPSKTITF